MRFLSRFLSRFYKHVGRDGNVLDEGGVVKLPPMGCIRVVGVVVEAWEMTW